MRGLLSRYRLRNTLVATGLALIGIVLVLLYVTGYRNNVLRGADLVQVFVAARDIPQGTTGADVAGGGYLERQSVLRRMQSGPQLPGAVAGVLLQVPELGAVASHVTRLAKFLVAAPGS